MPTTRSIQATTTAVVNNSYANQTLASDPTEAFYRFYLYVPAATLTSLESLGSFGQGELLEIWDAGRTSFQDTVYCPLWDGSIWNWYTYVSPGAGSEFFADTWYKVDYRVDRTGNKSQLWVDDVDQYGGEYTGNSATTLERFNIGATFTTTDADYYLTGVRVGTTRGGNELFDGDVDATVSPPFDNTVGTVTAVDSPDGGPATGDQSLQAELAALGTPNFIWQDFTSLPGLTEVFAQADVFFDDDALRGWVPHGQSGGFLELQGTVGTEDYEVLGRVYLVRRGARWVWALHGRGDGQGRWRIGETVVSADTHTVLLHFGAGDITATIGSETLVLPTGGRVHAVAVGQTFLESDTGAKAYVDNVLVGTTLGGDDLVSEDFSAATIT
jgi:hypothetical protein